jgi:hypothetical protein
VDKYDLKRFAKQIACRVPGLRSHLTAYYPYLHTPAQLAFLCACLEQTRNVPGCIVEAGCYQGNTTLYLNHHMTSLGIEKPYWALDTFSGVREEDLEVEVSHARGRGNYGRAFRVNDRRWFDAAMRRDGQTRVRSIAADIGSFDFGRLAPIAFCLVDVVFYQPVKRALPSLWQAISPGGMIVVDDYFGTGYYGAGQAYSEFIEAHHLEPRRVHTKYGLLVKETEVPIVSPDVPRGTGSSV